MLMIQILLGPACECVRSFFPSFFLLLCILLLRMFKDANPDELDANPQIPCRSFSRNFRISRETLAGFDRCGGSKTSYGIGLACGYSSALLHP